MKRLAFSEEKCPIAISRNIFTSWVLWHIFIKSAICSIRNIFKSLLNPKIQILSKSNENSLRYELLKFLKFPIQWIIYFKSITECNIQWREKKKRADDNCIGREIISVKKQFCLNPVLMFIFDEPAWKITIVQPTPLSSLSLSISFHMSIFQCLTIWICVNHVNLIDWHLSRNATVYTKSLSSR